MRGMATILATMLLATSAPAQDSLGDARRQLAEAKAAASAAATRAATLDTRADDERDAAAKARAQEGAVAARIAGAKSDIAAARARIAIVDRLLSEQRATLGAQQAPVARLLAALGSLARRPAVAAIAQPGSVDDLVHVRAVLGGVLPVVQQRTAAIRNDLVATRALQASAAVAAKSLRDGHARLVGERRALAALRAEHAARATVLDRDALAESDRAIAMGEAARDIVDRMDLIGGEQATRADLARLPGPPRSDAVEGPAAAYRLPVAGRLATGLGEISDSGVRARGLTFVVAPGAIVVAPAAGRVVFARAFRRFGTIVIIDHGAGWTTLVTGLAHASVGPRAPVAAGMPIGRAPTGEPPRITVELRRHGRPVDITALIA